MYAVEQYNSNGTTTLYGPMRRRKTAERFASFMGLTTTAVRQMTPWRRVQH